MVIKEAYISKDMIYTMEIDLGNSTMYLLFTSVNITKSKDGTEFYNFLSDGQVIFIWQDPPQYIIEILGEEGCI